MANLRNIISILFNYFVPAHLYGGNTAYSTLLEIERSLRESPGAGEVTAILERAKQSLRSQLGRRFEPMAAKALALKLSNLLLAHYHFRERHTILQSRPVGIIVDPSNMCRLACPGCVHSTRSESLRLFDWPNGTLTVDRASSLLKIYGPYALGIYFCSYGEPLLNLNTPKMIRTAKRYLLWTGLSTSLSVQQFDPESYIQSGLDFMVLAIDGATQSVYERYRRNGDLEVVFENVRRLVAAKRRLHSKVPVISWNYLAFEHNAHEIPAALRKARELGVDQFRVARPFDVSWDDSQLRPAADVDSRIYRLNRFSLSNPPLNWNPFPSEIERENIEEAFERPIFQQAAVDAPSDSSHTCHWLYKNLVMDAGGRILPCCSAPRPDADLVFAQFDSKGDPFNSEKYRQARLFFSNKTLAMDGSPYCTRCDWNQVDTNIGSREIQRYFRAANAAFFDRRSLKLLSDW
jgi:MoaA/NifB/PqqE/SkfB family radical SAM enzyme